MEVTENSATTSDPTPPTPRQPIVIIMVGLAGAGKTTLTKRLAEDIHRAGQKSFIMNLDPACTEPPYPVNIDIRDTLDFHAVRDQFNLGPNGGIVTCLNLFSTKFNEVMDILRVRGPSCDYILVDTPGQIEVFMWSASGQIIMECLGSMYTTVIAYVTDLKLSANPVAFMSNMTYACSVLYKTHLPVILALTKADRIDPSYAKSWITDFEAFDSVTRETEGYSATLASSLSLALEEMYQAIDHVAISAKKGDGMAEFFGAVRKAAEEYDRVYRPYFVQLKAAERASGERSQSPVELGAAYSTPGSLDAGAGLSIRLGLEEDDEDTSSEEEKLQDGEEEVEMSYSEWMKAEAEKRLKRMRMQ